MTYQITPIDAEPADLDLASELALFASNDSDVYFKSIVPVIHAHARLRATNEFDPDQRLRPWERTAAYAARRYSVVVGKAREPGTLGRFNAATREVAAKLLADSYEEEIVDTMEIILDRMPEAKVERKR